MSGMVYTGSESPWDWLGNTNLWNNLGFSLYAMLSICYMVAISDGKEKSKIEVSTCQAQFTSGWKSAEWTWR